MLIEVKVPHVLNAKILNWHKKEGESVARDEPLVDVESDKVAVEITAAQAGILSRIMKGDGSTVASGEVIGIIDGGA